jgi:hypothetical protein
MDGEGVVRQAIQQGGDDLSGGAGTVRAERAPASGRKRIVLSARDWEVLQEANEMKFLLYEQFARHYPEGPPNPHNPARERPTAGTRRRRERPGSWYARERLRKLVAYDVLNRVPIFTEPAGALLPGRTGMELLQGTGRCHGLSRLDAIDWKNFDHDRAATDIRWLFEKRFGGAWQSERVLRREMGSRQIPDALVTLEQQSIALEVELTRKSTARYLGIFQRYLEWKAPRIDIVLYVVPAKGDLAHLFGVVLPAVLARSELWGARQPDLSLFRFTTRDALLERRVWWSTRTPANPTGGSI